MCTKRRIFDISMSDLSRRFEGRGGVHGPQTIVDGVKGRILFADKVFCNYLVLKNVEMV